MSAFSIGISSANLIDPLTFTVSIASIPYRENEAGQKLYDWQNTRLNKPFDHSHTRAAEIAELAQIARFLDYNHRGGAVAQLQAYVYLAAWLWKQSKQISVPMAA